jgi:hypothetical protein
MSNPPRSVCRGPLHGMCGYYILCVRVTGLTVTTYSTNTSAAHIAHTHPDQESNEVILTYNNTKYTGDNTPDFIWHYNPIHQNQSPGLQ